MQQKNKDIQEVFSLFGQSVPISIQRYDKAPFENNFESHWHEKIEILVMIEGSLQTICDNCVFTAKQGDIVFVNPYEIHNGQTGTEGCAYYCIIMEPNVLVSLNMDQSDQKITDLQNEKIKISNHIQNDMMYQILLSAVQEYQEQKSDYDLFLHAYLMLFMGYAFRNYLKSQQTRAQSTISKVIVYLHEHYAEMLSTQIIAKHFGFSLSYLCRYFKSYTGETIMQYLNAIRINKACGLLQQTELPVTDVAQQVGYNSMNHFNEQFKNRVGMTPSRFRRSCRQI